ncbi:MAG: SIR2 family protein [Chitinophagales bacterium]
MRLPSHLIEAAKNQKLIPFIGAGFSFSLNLPSWSILIDEIAGELGYDSEILKSYGDYIQIAEFLYIQKNGIGKLQSKLDRSFNNDTIDISKSQPHMLLTKMKAKKIYTTNWDNWIEEAYDYKNLPYNKIVNINDLVNSNPDSTHIIKFHGDLSTRDEDIVFTETSYFDRLSFESPLDITLRSDMLSNTMLFIGYSLSDFNIRYMLYKLQKLISNQISTKARPPLAYIILATPNPILETIFKNSRNMEVVYLDPRDRQKSLISILEEIALNVQ